MIQTLILGWKPRHPNITLSGPLDADRLGSKAIKINKL